MRHKVKAAPDLFRQDNEDSKLQLTIRSPCYEGSRFVTDYFYSHIWERTHFPLGLQLNELESEI